MSRIPFTHVKKEKCPKCGCNARIDVTPNYRHFKCLSKKCGHSYSEKR